MHHAHTQNQGSNNISKATFKVIFVSNRSVLWLFHWVIRYEWWKHKKDRVMSTKAKSQCHGTTGFWQVALLRISSDFACESVFCTLRVIFWFGCWIRFAEIIWSFWNWQVKTSWESLSYITSDGITYVVSWLKDMKAVSETVMSSSPLDIMVTEERSWMSPLGRCQMCVITCLTLPGCRNCLMPSPVSCLSLSVSHSAESCFTAYLQIDCSLCCGRLDWCLLLLACNVCTAHTVHSTLYRRNVVMWLLLASAAPPVCI